MSKWRRGKAIYGRPGATYLDVPDDIITGKVDESKVVQIRAGARPAAHDRSKKAIVFELIAPCATVSRQRLTRRRRHRGCRRGLHPGAWPRVPLDVGRL